MRNKYLRVRINTCADVNLMPVSVYRLLYHDHDLKKLTSSQLKIGTYTNDTVKILGSCTIYPLHPESKKLKEAVFYIVSNDDSVLLSCNTSLALGIIQPIPRLDYLPPRASLITSNADHPRKTRGHLQIQKQEITAQTKNQPEDTQFIITMQTVHKLITSQNQIMHEYPDVFEGIGKFPGPPYHIQVDPSVTPKWTPCRPIPIHLKEASQKESNKMLQAGVHVPVTEATPWINIFILVESKDKQGQLKLRICLDPTNLNKAVTREPYHFHMPEDISHMPADACILTVCDCKKGYWYQKLDEASSYLTTFNTEMGMYRFTVMIFDITVAGDVFQCKLDECFGQRKNLIVIADDIMVIGRNQNHKDHDLAFTTLLQTGRKCNFKLNYEKPQYECMQVNFYGETYTTDGCKTAQIKITEIVELPSPSSKKEVQSFISMINYLSKFLPRLTELAEPIRELVKEKVPFKSHLNGTCLSLLYPKKRNCTTNRCKYKGIRILLISRGETHLLCK